MASNCSLLPSAIFGDENAHETLYPSSHKKISGNNTILKQWFKFYEDWFGLNIKLIDFEPINKQEQGLSIFVRPIELSAIDYINKFEELSQGNVKIDVTNYQDPILNERQRPHPYIVHQRQARNILENLAHDLFFIYQKRAILVDRTHERINYTYIKAGKIYNSYKLYPKQKHGKITMLQRIPIQKKTNQKKTNRNKHCYYFFKELEYWIKQA